MFFRVCFFRCVKSSHFVVCVICADEVLVSLPQAVSSRSGQETDSQESGTDETLLTDTSQFSSPAETQSQYNYSTWTLYKSYIHIKDDGV